MWVLLTINSMKRVRTVSFDESGYTPKSSRPSKGYNKKYSKKKRSVSRSLVTKAQMDKAINKSEEVKCFQSYMSNVNLSAYGTTLGGYLLPVSPYQGVVQIVQGLGQGDRLGNRIKTKKCIIDMQFKPLPYNAATNILGSSPWQVVGYFYTNKDDVNGSVLPDNTFIQSGNSSVPLTGTDVDLISVVNKDRWQVYKKFSFMLGYESYSFNGGATAQVLSYNDCPYNVRKRFDITKWVPKFVTYNDTSTNPTSKCVSLYLEVVNAGGGTSSASTINAQVTYSIDYEYTDA
uniref:Capsid protein n=1 Tax=uncultured prokaryote TaxID=198431 RepID=A0A0H5Q764_9ZZZZ|nr:hypothetical protein [uncultured prokaryote]